LIFSPFVKLINVLDQLINLLQGSLHQKNVIILEWEDKYKRFVEKAKCMVKSMDTKNPTQSEVDYIQAKLINTNKQFEDLTVFNL